MRDPNKDYGLEINEVWIAKNDLCPNGCIGIDWSGNIGFGQWVAELGDDGKLHANTECMDSNDDKLFTKQLLEALLKEIVIEG